MKKSLADLQKIVRGKKLVIWGAMIVGQGICRVLERYDLSVNSFIDSSDALQGQEALRYPIESPAAVIHSENQDEQVIIVASGHYDLEIEQICLEAGLQKDVHYVMSYELNDVDPSIDVSGVCNLRCISCPRGNMKEHATPGFMNLAQYKQVLDKLLDELPFLGSIQLYTWGEPLLNRELSEIIRYTRERNVLTALSSNLNAPVGYQEVIQAGLDWFKISASGFEESYEITHTGGKWSNFLSNLKKVVALRKELAPEMQIILNYHLYKHNIGQDYERMKNLCHDFDIIFRPSPAYLYPLDNVWDYIDGKRLSVQSLQTLDLLLMELDDGIQKALKRQENRCPEERCLPITWDKKVRFCGVYYNPFICDNFLDIPIEEILQRRKKSDFCKECKKRGLHQFTGVYLAEHYLNED